MKDWTLDARGNVILNPVMGWETAVASEMACLLKVQFALSEEDMRKGGQSLQLVMTPSQAAELAQVLLRMAETTKEEPAPQVAN